MFGSMSVFTTTWTRWPSPTSMPSSLPSRTASRPAVSDATVCVRTCAPTADALATSCGPSDAVDDVTPTSSVLGEPETSFRMTDSATRITTLATVAIRNALERSRVAISRCATSPTTCRAEARRPGQCRDACRFRWPCSCGDSLLDVGRDIAVDDGSDGSAAGSPATAPPPVSSATMWRNRSARSGRRRANSCTGPVASAARSTAWSSVPGLNSRRVRVPVCDRTVTPAMTVGPARSRGRSVDHEQVRAGAAQLVDRSVGDHVPATDDPDAVAQPLHEIELVAGEHHRHALIGLLPQHAAHHVDRDRVQAGERLVQHEDLRVVDEGGGELHPLLVAEAQLLHVVVAALGDAEPLGPGVRRPSRRRRRHPVQARQVDELVDRRASAGRGRAPPACTRCCGGCRDRPLDHPTGPRRHRPPARPARCASWSSFRRRSRRQSRRSGPPVRRTSCLRRPPPSPYRLVILSISKAGAIGPPR